MSGFGSALCEKGGTGKGVTQLGSLVDSTGVSRDLGAKQGTRRYRGLEKGRQTCLASHECEARGEKAERGTTL